MPVAYKLMCFDRNIYENSDVKFLECDYLLEQQWSITYFSTGWDNQTPKSPLLQKHLKIMKARYPCLIVHISKGMINCYVYVIKLVWKSSSTKCLEAERRQQLVFGYRPKFRTWNLDFCQTLKLNTNVKWISPLLLQGHLR